MVRAKEMIRGRRAGLAERTLPESAPKGDETVCMVGDGLAGEPEDELDGEGTCTTSGMSRTLPSLLTSDQLTNQ